MVNFWIETTGGEPAGPEGEWNATPSAVQPGWGKYSVLKWSMVTSLGNVSRKDAVTVLSEKGKYRTKKKRMPTSRMTEADAIHIHSRGRWNRRAPPDATFAD